MGKEYDLGTPASIPAHPMQIETPDLFGGRGASIPVSAVLTLGAVW